MRQLIRYLIWFLLLFAAYNSQAQNNTVYGAGISYTNGAPTWTPNPRTSRAAVDTVTGRWYHFNTPGGWQWIGNTVEEISGCAAPAYTPSKGDSRLVINNCVKPQVYWYDGAAWIWINQGEVYTAGQGIRIESNTIILDSLYVLRFRTGSNTDGAAGTMSWNATEETLDLVTDQGAVTGHLMESAYYNTRNTTGTPITIGTVVMANGTTGNTGRILIAPAIADGSVNSEYILGLAAQTIGNNSNGKVQHFGKIRGIQTNGANYGETWVDGDVLYCSSATPGYLTKVLPTAPNLKVPIAIVIHAHPSNGTLFVRPSHFPDLAQINDVQLSSPTNGQVLTWNSTNARWEAITPANQLQTLSTNGTPGNISILSGNTITLNVNDADASATNELQTLSVAANTATLSNSGGSVTIAGAGINTVGTAGTTITVTGTEIDGSTTNELQALSTGTNTLTLSSGGGTVTVDTDPTNDVTGSGTSGQVSYWNGTQTQTGSSDLTYSTTGNGRLFVGPSFGDGKLNLSQQAGDNLFYQNCFSTTTGHSNYWLVRKSASNTVGTITETTNGHALGTLYFQGVNTSNTYAYGAQIIAQQIGAAGTFVPTSLNFRTYSSTAQNNNQLFLSQNSNVGINIGAPAGKLHVVGSGTSSSTWTAQFHNSAGNNNALMIRDDGNVGVGTNAPTRQLTVAGDAQINELRIGRGTNSLNNVVLGTGGTMNSITTGTGNIGIGSNAVRVTTTGQNNIGIGPNSLWSNIGGNGNIAIGSEPMFRQKTGSDCVVIGTSALGNNDLNDQVVAIGSLALFNSRNSDNSVAIGSAAGRLVVAGTANTRAQNSIFIGRDTRPLDSLQTNQIVIADLGRGLGSNTTRIGNSSTTQTHLDGSLTIGDTTLDPSAILDVSSTTQGVLFPRMTTTERNAIATPADGLVIYNTTDNKLQVRAAGAWVDLH